MPFVTVPVIQCHSSLTPSRSAYFPAFSLACPDPFRDT